MSGEATRAVGIRSWTFELTGPRYSANDRLHWRTANRLKTQWRQTAFVMASSLRRPQLEHAHVLVEQVPGSRRKTDPGNVAPAAKAAVDGLVEAGVIVDDDAAHLLGPDFRLADPQPVSRGQWRLRLTVTELVPVDSPGAWMEILPARVVECPTHPVGECPGRPEECLQ